MKTEEVKERIKKKIRDKIIKKRIVKDMSCLNQQHVLSWNGEAIGTILKTSKINGIGSQKKPHAPSKHGGFLTC
jgi:hypothetical protein